MVGIIRIIGIGMVVLGGLGLVSGIAQVPGGGPWGLGLGGGLLGLVSGVGLLYLSSLLGQGRPAGPQDTSSQRRSVGPQSVVPLDDYPPDEASFGQGVNPGPQAMPPAYQALQGNLPGTHYVRLPGTVLPLHPSMPDAMLLEIVRALEPGDFEHFCRVLLAALGYSDVQVRGRSGDEGVDITMRYGDQPAIAQCKRYAGTVGQPSLRDFYGTLVHTRATLGFFLTTGQFSKQAREWAAGKPLQLVDGQQLVTAIRALLLRPEAPPYFG